MSRVGPRDSRRRQNDPHLHHVATSSLRARAQSFLVARHVRPLSLGQTTPVYRFCQGLIGAVLLPNAVPAGHTLERSEEWAIGREASRGHRCVLPLPAARSAKHSECAARSPQIATEEGTGGHGASEKGTFRARLTPRDNARRSPCSNILPAAHTEIEDGMRHAPAFSSQKPINMRHHGNDALRLSPRGGGPQRPACFRPVQRRAARRREWHELAADWHAIAGLATMAPLHRWALHTAASASDCETRS